MELDLEALKAWIGRTAEEDDIVTPRLAAEYDATLTPTLARVGAGEAPLALHWCLSPTISPIVGLGRDGHPAKGGFLPPVPLPRRMWAGGSIKMLAPLRIGDTVKRRSTIADIMVKQGRTGTLCFVAVDHEYSTLRGVALTERHDIVYRGATDAAAKVPPAAEPRESDLSWQVDATPTLLFRYSAMTFNGHRIHYDQPYVTGVEDYAGLVVHGPLQASLMLNLAAELGGGVPGMFRYRGLTPLIAGQRFQVRAARRPEGGISCWTENAAGQICMEATAS